ncbi:hypothetical protein JQN58_18130 [Aneurinibacillus sp. BA2021]|nr:hypothetical protein [Aneurinibacillus sp. BA2021]
MRVRFLDEDGEEYVVEPPDVDRLLSALQRSRSIAFRHKWYNVGDIIHKECSNETGEPGQEVIVSLINKAIMLK